MTDDNYETWFRGEGVGVAPGKPGGNLSDFGDGMYLTDRADVAAVYAARRSPAPEGRRVLEVSLSRGSLGQVLDLSTDARWFQFINDKRDPMLLGKSRMQYLQQQHEIYAQFFSEFLKRNNINIDMYDAVIGPEYTTGGRQLCILSKNGQPSKLQNRVRVLLRLKTGSPSAPPAVVVDESPTGLASRSTPAPGPEPVEVVGRVRVGIRMIARVGAIVGGSLLLGYLGAKLREWAGVDQKALDKAMKDLEPAIDQQLAQYTPKALALVSVGRPAYANIVVKVSYVVSTDVMDGQAESMQSIPTADLTSVYVSHVKLDAAGREEESSKFPYTATFYSYPLFISPPLTFPKDQVDQFHAAVTELAWYEDTLTNNLLDKSDVNRLKQEMQTKDAKFHQAYGPFPPPPVGAEKGYKFSYHIGNWFDDD